MQDRAGKPWMDHASMDRERVVLVYSLQLTQYSSAQKRRSPDVTTGFRIHCTLQYGTIFQSRDLCDNSCGRNSNHILLNLLIFEQPRGKKTTCDNPRNERRCRQCQLRGRQKKACCRTSRWPEIVLHRKLLFLQQMPFFFVSYLASKETKLERFSQACTA